MASGPWKCALVVGFSECQLRIRLEDPSQRSVEEMVVVSY